MNETTMLEAMCRSVLSNSDIQAIAKSRGFSPAEKASRTNFENAFLSDVGLEAVFASLGVEEIACLHLLAGVPVPVDTRYFTRLYKEAKNRWNSTFTQRYTPVFKAVQTSLVRKGVLLIEEEPKLFDNKPKMERWRFRFPQEFAAHLPAPFARTQRYALAGNVTEDALRRKLREVCSRRGPAATGECALTLRHGRLCMGESVFSLSNLWAWQHHAWNEDAWSAMQRRNLPGKTGDRTSSREKVPKDFTAPVLHALSRLAPDEWIRHEELGPLLRLYHHPGKPPHTEDVCEAGFRLGCLARHRAGEAAYYRSADLTRHAGRAPEDYLTFEANDLRVDMQAVPYRDLELIASIAKLTVTGTALVARPDIIRLGGASDRVWNDPLTQWIRRHATPFGEAMSSIEAHRGKQIVHDNLLIARVKDLSLRVQIQKAISQPGRLVSLPSGYIAFPIDALGDISRLLTRSGYVIKTIEAP
jgi:hypothetical protein